MKSVARGPTAAGRAAIAVSAALLLVGGCASQDDPNTPLPRMAKDDALKWTKDSTAHMAELTDVELLPDTANVNFEACIGENDEVAQDGPVQPLLLRLFACPRHGSHPHRAEASPRTAQAGLRGEVVPRIQECLRVRGVPGSQ